MRITEELSNNTSIVTAILGNIFFCVAMNLQKYAKKQIILMALHGLPDVNLRRLWIIGLSMLLASECTNFVSFGVISAATMTPLGVFTIISNCALPPLLFESHMHTSIGTLISMPGILLLIVLGPRAEPPNTGFILGFKGKLVLQTELLVGILFVAIRAYKPANCSLKLGANCGLSALMGSHTVTAVKAMMSSDFDENTQGVCLLVALLTCALDLILLTESMQSFPVWQVVPHYFSIFITLVYVNSGTLFGQFDQVPRTEILWCCFSYALIVTGVWVSAIPHLDIPLDIKKDAPLLGQLARDATYRCICVTSSAATRIGVDLDAAVQSVRSPHTQREEGHSSNHDEIILSNGTLREEYAKHRHTELQREQGFGRSHPTSRLEITTP